MVGKSARPLPTFCKIRSGVRAFKTAKSEIQIVLKFNGAKIHFRIHIMIKSLKDLFPKPRFVGPNKSPKRWDKPQQMPQRLLSRDFVLLFLMAMCSNSFIAVYYCFEQWMDGLGVTASWRGVLLSSLFAMILLFRPLTSVVLLKRSKLWPMIISLLVATLVMLCYPLVRLSYAIPMILSLRLVQGIALAVYSACTVAVLVQCIPPGQSARGFAIFSLTMLLPYSIIPALSEELIPLVGGEAQLFATMAFLGIPSFLMLYLLSKRLRKPEIPPVDDTGKKRKSLMHSITHSGLGFVYAACFSFSITTILAIFFMKGLCSIRGEHAAWFFSTYSLTIILVRVFGSRLMDTLPRHRVSVVCAVVLGLVMLGFAWGPPSFFIPLACTYGLALGLLYPLLAAGVYDRSTPETRSVNSNVMMATFDASGMLGPILGGVVIDYGFGYDGVFCTAGISAICCGFFMICDYIRFHKKRRSKPETAS